MTLVKRGKDTWQVRIFLGRDENGKTRFFNQTVKGRRKDAEILETKKKRELDLGIFIDRTQVTVDEYLDNWLEVSAKPRLKGRTFDDYSEYMNRYVRPAIGKINVSKVKPLDFQNLYSQLTEKGLSGRTVRYTHAILNSAFKQAVKWQIINQNPASMVDLPKLVRREMRVLSPSECSRFLASAENDRWGIIFSLALSTGMRPEEYLGLRWKDVDLESGTVSITRVLVRNRKGGGWSLEEPKTPKSRRIVPLPSTVTRDLAAHRRDQLAERLKVGPAYENQDFVFATEIGTPLLHSNVSKRHFKRIVVEAGLSAELRLYDLRHTCATLLLLEGISPKVVAERLGHASVVQTLDTYSHVLPTMQEDATNRLEKMLFSTARM